MHEVGAGIAMDVGRALGSLSNCIISLTMNLPMTFFYMYQMITITRPSHVPAAVAFVGLAYWTR